MPRFRLSRTTRLGVLSALVGGVAACSGILGINDRSLDTEGADAATPDGSLQGDSGHPNPGDGSPGDSAAPPGDTGGGGPGDSSIPPCATPCPIAMNLHQPLDIASDANNVYWTEYGDGDGASNGYVKGCPIAGCNGSPTIYAQAQVNPYGIATDGKNLYWSTVGAGGNGGNGIWTCPVTGCTAPTQLATPDNPQGVAIDDNYVYWVGYYDDMVQRVPKGGGTDTILWDASTGGVNAMLGIAVDDASIYAIDNWTDLLRIPIGGGAAVTINDVSPANAQLGNWNVALDPKNIYYGIFGGIVRTPKTSTTPGPTIGTLQQPWAVTYDSASGAMYYADFGSGADTDGVIGKIPSGSSTLVPLQSSLVEPVSLTVTGNYVFWTSRGTGDAQGNTIAGTGAVYRAPK